MKKAYLIIYSIVLVVVTSTVTFFAASSIGVDTGDLKLAEARAILERYYYKDVDEAALSEGAVAGMMASLDEYTCYLNAADYDAVIEAFDSSYSGVGVLLGGNTSDDYVTVVGTFDGSPARAVGLEMGDKIIAIDGAAVFSDKLEVASSLLKGVAGTEVIMTVLKYGASEAGDIVARRAVIAIDTVVAEMMGDGIGYINILTFSDGTGKEFEAKLQELIALGAEKLIIDLRDNTGGIVEACVEIADLFLAGEVIYSYKGRGISGEVIYADGERLQMPLVVLTNGYTASASEILVGALKDHGVAEIIGEKTYGKGVMQSVVSLGDGSALKITIANYFTPNGTDIDGVGIEPDIEVAGEDAQMARALEILK